MKKYAAAQMTATRISEMKSLNITIADTISVLDSLLRVISFAPIISSPKTASMEKKETSAIAKLIWPNPSGKRILAR